MIAFMKFVERILKILVAVGWKNTSGVLFVGRRIEALGRL